MNTFALLESRLANFDAIKTRSNLQTPKTQLPINAYCSEAIFKEEQRRIFDQASLYVGNQRLVPEQGDWFALPQEDNGRVLIHNTHGVQLLSNVCRHRQAIMLGDADQLVRPSIPNRGNLGGANARIRCPLHAWTYNDTGKLIAAHKMSPTPCKHLDAFPLQSLSGFLFEGKRDVKGDIGHWFDLPEFDFSDYQLGHVELHSCHCNWKTFIEIYNEEYHIAPFHPGLRKYVECNQIDWEFSDWGNLQRVGINPNLRTGGTELYEKWHQALLQHTGGTPPNFGAMWAAYYPTHMIEVYPYALAISTLYPQGVHETLNLVEFYYPKQLLEDFPELVESHHRAYMETAAEDDEIAERIDAGRRALYQRSRNEDGPYQTPLEDGMPHFHQWYRDMMGDALA